MELAVVVVVKSGGERAFCAGASFDELMAISNEEEGLAFFSGFAKVINAMRRCPKFIVGRVQGKTVGGGVGLAASCDMRFCGNSSQFAIPAAKLGLGYEYEGINRLVQLIGPAFTKEIFYTARRFSAEEMIAMGFINKILDDTSDD